PRPPGKPPKPKPAFPPTPPKPLPAPPRDPKDAIWLGKKSNRSGRPKVCCGNNPPCPPWFPPPCCPPPLGPSRWATQLLCAKNRGTLARHRTAIASKRSCRRLIVAPLSRE